MKVKWSPGPRPGLELGHPDPVTSVLTMRPPRLLLTIKYMFVCVSSKLCVQGFVYRNLCLHYCIFNTSDSVSDRETNISSGY